MDFAITLAGGRDTSWEVVCFREARGGEVAVPLATFGHRGHAEAFLADLLAMIDGVAMIDGSASECRVAQGL